MHRPPPPPPQLSENESVPVGAREGFLASGLVRKGHTHGPEPAPHHQASPAQTSCPRPVIMPNVTHRKPRQGPPVFTGAAPHPQSTWVALAIPQDREPRRPGLPRSAATGHTAGAQ